MEEKKGEGLMMFCVAAFVIFLVSIMSFSLWRDRQINAFMTTNRAWGIQCDMISQAAWVIRKGERVDLEMDHLFLYCEGDHFVGRDDAGIHSITLDKYIVYQYISHQPH